MPTFTFTSPDGKNYSVQGPEGATQEQAFEILQKQIGTKQAQSPSPSADRSVIDKLTGTGGERYQTWPERAIRGLAGSVKSAVTLPGDVMSGQTKLPSRNGIPGSAPEESGQAIMEPNALAAMLGAPKDARWEAPASGSPFGRSTELGLLASPVNPAVRAGDRAIPGVASASMVKERPPIPTTEQLKTAGAADIKAAGESGLEVTASSVGEMSRKIQRELFDSGIHPVDAPNTFTKLKELENAPAGAIATASNLNSLRHSLGTTAQNFNPNAAKDQLAATRAIRGLDEFIPNLSPKDTLVRTASTEGVPATREQLIAQAIAGKREAERVSDLLKSGRGNYAAAMRSNDITGTLDRANTGILERAQVRAQAANSGRNLDNTLRSKVASLLEKPKEVSGFSDAELTALNKFVEGGSGRNTARYIANLLGGGGGVGQAMMSAGGAAGGASVGGLPGAAIGAVAGPATGAVSKSIANALAKRSLNKVDELIRTRSPLYEEALRAADSIPAHLGKKAAIAKAILMQSLGERQ